MKESQLRQIIREEISSVLNELNQSEELSIDDLQVGFPIKVEGDSGIYLPGFITNIRGNRISVEGKNFESSLLYGSNKLSVPYYNLPFKTQDGKTITIEK